jgi:hypothetical protein
LYWWYSLRYVGSFLYRPVLGTVTIVLLYVLSRRSGPNSHAGREPVGLFLLSMLFFVMPVASGPAPRGHGFVAAALGSFVAQGAWALYRYPFRAQPFGARYLQAPLRNRVVPAMRVGAGMALLLSLYVAVIFTIAALTSVDARSFSLLTDYLLVVLSYLAAGLLGGAVIGMLAPLARWPVGALILGIPLTGAIYGSVAVAMEHMKVLSDGTDPTTLPPLAGLVILTYIGPMWGIMAKEWIEGA